MLGLGVPERQAGCGNSKPMTSPSLRSLHTRDKWFIEVGLAACWPRQPWSWGHVITRESSAGSRGGGLASLPPAQSTLFPRLRAQTQRLHLR